MGGGCRSHGGALRLGWADTQGEGKVREIENFYKVQCNVVRGGGGWPVQKS